MNRHAMGRWLLTLNALVVAVGGFLLSCRELELLRVSWESTV